MIKHIIFDFDGTIANSHDVILEIGNQIADKYGLDRVTHEDLIKLKSLPIKEKCKKLGIPLIKLPQFYLELVNNIRNKATSIKIFEGMKELITELSHSSELTIITSNSIELVKGFLKNHDIKCFSRIESSSGLFDKDSSLKKFLKSNKVDKAHVLYIGDELRDIIACKNAGIKIISVTWGYDSYELLEKANPDYLVTHPTEIIEIVKSHF